jgi:hypothetical protein
MLTVERAIRADNQIDRQAHRPHCSLSRLFAAKFAASARKTFIKFMPRDYPGIVDPIFPGDPRFDKHIIQRP